MSLCAGLVVSSPAQRVAFNHQLSPTGRSAAPRSRTMLSAPESVKILAVMVDFKADNDDRTAGTGKFDLSVPTKRIIDSPPRQKPYFDRHLTFVENYFRKVSNGKLVVTGDVLDSVYHLPNFMQTYSPPHGSTTNVELGSLITDTWHLVDSVTPGIPYEEYNAFVIFHAGAGHDIDFVSIYGYDPTPYDIPSIYLGLTGLQKIYGPAYQGVPVRNGTYFINNSMILPETENRAISSIGGNYLLQLGINGLFAASIGSYLGLPDLFDTKDGSSGIGRFGLMDGQSIFSWSGVFPPEPSAWEKYDLGWVNPITITSGTSNDTLPAVGLSASNDTVYKVFISAKEYFLIENRNRDAHQDSAIVWMTTDAGTVRRAWARDTTGFSFFSQDSLYGTITDVDEFDWSLPGYATTETPGGGLLIWHIDENIIDANRASNAINADPNHKGVNLMEADGSQDIGQSYSILQAGQGSEAGTQLDYWYKGNRAPLRAVYNQFSPISFPNSKSNSGANSHIYVKQFSVISPRMSVTIQVGDSLIAPLAGFPKNISGPAGNISIKSAVVNGSPSILIGSNNVLYGWHDDGSPLLNGLPANGVDAFGPFVDDVITGDFNHNGVTDIAAPVKFLTPGTLSPTYFLNGFSVSDSNSDGIIDPLFSKSAQSVTSSLTSSDSLIAWGDNNSVDFLRLSDDSVLTSGSFSAATGNVVGVSLLNRVSRGAFVSISSGGLVVILTSGISTFVANPSMHFPGTMVAPVVIGYPNSGKGKRIMFASKEGALYATDSLLHEIAGFPVQLDGEVHTSPAYADVDGDGVRDIVLFVGNKIYAVNSTGAILSHFPVTVPSETSILSAPVIADVDGDGNVDIVAVTQEGLVLAYDRNGALLQGFPLMAGTNSGSTPTLFLSGPHSTSISLAVAGDDGHIYGWQTGSAQAPADIPIWASPWPQKMHDAQNSGLEDSFLPAPVAAKEFFPASLAYNWPNPVGKDQNYRTHIRYFLGQSASVDIKIFDMAGQLVTAMNAQGTGGMDNEVEWDVSKIQSGVYFAHIEAQGASDHGVAVIKIAVIK